MKNDIDNEKYVNVYASEDFNNPLCGEIKFRKDNKGLAVKYFFRGVTYILVAAISGGITGAYVANKKVVDVSINSSNNAALLQDKNRVSSSYSKTSNLIARVVEDVGQAVVGISNSGVITPGSSDGGSGIIISSDGYIVTNYHVIKGSNVHLIRLSNSKNANSLTAKVIGYDSISDLAVLKVAAKSLPKVVFGDSSKVQVGDSAIAIGNLQGEEFSGSATAGIISTVNREIEVPDKDNGTVTTYKVIQTDAEINYYNDGGALCNQNGEVIGINTLRLSENGTASGMGFAISINEAKKIIDSIIKNGHVIRPAIGFSTEDVVSSDNKLKGVLVKSIINNALGKDASIKINDLITEFDGVKLKSSLELYEIVERHKVGDSIPCKVLREGKSIYTKVVLSEKATYDN